MTQSQTTQNIEAHLVELDKLQQHEEVDQSHLMELTEEIASDKILKFAIVADKNTNIILDGEHRFNALKQLGCKKIPVVYVDYNSPNIEVQTWGNTHLTKKDVIDAGLSGKNLPPKTSRHMIRNGNNLVHISSIEKEVNVPLELLRRDVELVDVTSVKPTMHTELKETLQFYANFLNTEIVDESVILDEKTNVILKGHEIFHALDLLTARKIPALKIDISKVHIESQQSNLKPITKEAIIAAGIKGPKLPPKSYEVLIERLKVKFPLEELIAQERKDKRDLKIYENTLELLCNGWPTPLVKLNSLTTSKRIVWAKLEGHNPFSNSVKDRIGFAMIMEALKNGKLEEILYEATSTNTGIALTSIANILGLKTKLYMPYTIQKVSDTYLKVLGADVVRLPVGLTVEAISQVEAEAKANKATHLNQFENDANFTVHLKHTAREIDIQLKSLGLKPSCIIGGLGTSGHMSAVSFYFKTKYKNDVHIIGVQPALNEVVPGIRRIETGMKWYHWMHFDEIVDVRQKEAIEGAINIAKKEGLLIGLSAGAVVHAFNKVAKNYEGTCILIFPDTGYKYAEQFENYFKTCKADSEIKNGAV